MQFRQKPGHTYRFQGFSLFCLLSTMSDKAHYIKTFKLQLWGDNRAVLILTSPVGRDCGNQPAAKKPRKGL